MASQNAAKVVVDRSKAIAKAFEELVSQRVAVGWPESSAARDDGVLNNPTLAYVHENGAPEVGIPARPALQLAIQRSQAKINERLKKSGRAGLDGKPREAEVQLMRLGQELADAARAEIAAGIPPPLKESTLRARRRRRRTGRKEASAELAQRAAGADAGVDLAKPLLFSGQYAHALSYVMMRAKK